MFPSGRGGPFSGRPDSIVPSFFAPLNDAGAGAVNLGLLNGSGAATYSRATPAQALLSDGTFATVISGTARSWYLPSGIYAGGMFEGLRTNRCVRSQSFGSDWSAVGTPTRSAATTILGVCQLDTIGDDAAGTLEGYTLAVTFVGDAVKSVAVAVKKDTSTSSVIRLRDGTAAADRLLAVVTWSGTVPVVTMTTGGDLTGTPQQIGTSGVYILNFLTTAVTAASANQLEIYPATDAALSVGGTGNIQIGMVQEEDGTFASSPIITTGSAVARNADVLTYPFAGNALTLTGTAYAELSVLWATASPSNPQVALTFAASDILYNLGVPLSIGATSIRIRDGTNTPVFVGASLATGVRKRMSSWGAAGLSIVGDGATVVSSAFDGDIGSTAIAIGCDTSGTRNWFGTAKNVKMWLPQFADGTLQSMSG